MWFIKTAHWTIYFRIYREVFPANPRTAGNIKLLRKWRLLCILILMVRKLIVFNPGHEYRLVSDCNFCIYTRTVNLKKLHYDSGHPHTICYQSQKSWKVIVQIWTPPDLQSFFFFYQFTLIQLFQCSTSSQWKTFTQGVGIIIRVPDCLGVGGGGG